MKKALTTTAKRVSSSIQGDLGSRLLMTEAYFAGCGSGCNSTLISSMCGSSTSSTSASSLLSSFTKQQQGDPPLNPLTIDTPTSIKKDKLTV